MSQTKVQKFLGAIVGPFQTLEDAAQQCIFDRGVNTAVGAQLDTIGKIVGIPRNGVTDDEIYRRLIRAQISSNKSDGLIEDMLTITDLVVFDPAATYVLDNTGVAAFVLKVEGVVLTFELAEFLMRFLRRAVSAGVRIIMEFWQEPETDMFTFDGGAGLGFGDTLNALTGGAFASAIE